MSIDLKQQFYFTHILKVRNLEGAQLGGLFLIYVVSVAASGLEDPLLQGLLHAYGFCLIALLLLSSRVNSLFMSSSCKKLISKLLHDRPRTVAIFTQRLALMWQDYNLPGLLNNSVITDTVPILSYFIHQASYKSCLDSRSEDIDSTSSQRYGKL